jgi:Family of unknown function (DUF6220)
VGCFAGRRASVAWPAMTSSSDHHRPLEGRVAIVTSAPVHVIQRWLVRLIVGAVVAQFVLAGAGAFGATSFKPHTAVGWATVILCLIALALAALSRRAVRASAALFLAVVVQVALGVLGENTSAWFGAVHGLNALLVAGAAVHLTRRTQAPDRRLTRSHQAPAGPSPPSATTRTGVR